MNTNAIKYLGWVIAVILLIVLLRGCGKEDTKTVYIEVPAKEGSFPEVVNPEPIPAPKKEYVYLAGNTDTIKVPNPINAGLWNYYVNSQKKDSLYADAIGEREYTITNEDSLLITNNHIKAQGKVLSFKQDYTIKPQKIAVKQKETVFRLLGGLEVGSNKDFTDYAAKANLMFQGKGGNILSVGYDTEQRIYVGYGFSIWNYRK